MGFTLRLQGVKDTDGTSLYALYVKVLNAADHGLPQSRQRLFIVGLQRKLIRSPFKWPKVQDKVSFQTILQKNIVGGGRSLDYIQLSSSLDRWSSRKPTIKLRVMLREFLQVFWENIDKPMRCELHVILLDVSVSAVYVLPSMKIFLHPTWPSRQNGNIGHGPTLALLAVVFASFVRMPALARCMLWRSTGCDFDIFRRRFSGHPKDHWHVMQSACWRLARRRCGKQEEIQRRRFGEGLILKGMSFVSGCFWIYIQCGGIAISHPTKVDWCGCFKEVSIKAAKFHNTYIDQSPCIWWWLLFDKAEPKSITKRFLANWFQRTVQILYFLHVLKLKLGPWPFHSI